jgi:hypothetical protein
VTSARLREAAVRTALLASPTLLVLLAAALGARGARTVTLDLGPGDGPFTRGFTSPRAASFDPYERRDGAFNHWTGRDARIVLPLEVRAPSVGVRFRFARHLPERGTLEARVAGSSVRWEVRGGYQDYEGAFRVEPPVPLELDLHLEAADDRPLGVSADVLRFDLPEGAQVRLYGPAFWRPPVAVALGTLVLLVVGGRPRAAAALGLALALPAACGLLADPWLTYRLLRGVPETLAGVGLPGLALLGWLAGRGTIGGSALVRAAALLTLLFAARAAAVNHPRFYYPDLRLHAGLVAMVREAGVDVLRAPATWLYTPRPGEEQAEGLKRATSGLWLREVAGVPIGLPYSVAFHGLLAPLRLDYDATLCAVRLAGALASSLAAALFVFLAPRFGVPWWSAVLVAAAPVAAAELSLGAAPALFGHAADVAVLLVVAGSAATFARAPTIGRAALAVAAAQLAYVSAVLLWPALLVGLAAGLALLDREPHARRRAGGALVALVLGSSLALALYYRDFLSSALTAARLLLAGGTSPELADPGEGRAMGALLAWGFPVLPLLAAAGLVVRLRDPGAGRVMAFAWAAACAGLLAGQWAAPGLLAFLHLPLFATPLVALAAAAALERLRARGALGAAAAALLGALLVAQGVFMQARLLLAPPGSGG